jgi:ABC-type multidrug transport system permease subunit
MKTIVVLDDKDHALKQIEHEFPPDEWKKYNAFHFDTFELFSRQKINSIDIIFLDFFLSKDRIYGKDILPNLQSKILVCFSSKKEMSDAMAQRAVEGGFYLFQNVYSVRKLKNSLENSELKRVLSDITWRFRDD